MINRILFILTVVKLAMTLYQRRYNLNGGVKRMASFCQSLFLIVLYGAMSGLKLKGLDTLFIYGVLAVFLAIGILFRKRLFPYKCRCVKCGKSLNIKQILFIDSHLCNQCVIKD